LIDRATLAAAAPGLALVALLAAVAYASTLILPDVFGAVTSGLFLGIIVANVRPLPQTEAGAKAAKAWFLPLGILLLGARLSLADILSTGLGAILVLAVDIVLVLVVTIGLGRTLGLSEKLSVLIGVGTSICGNTAIAATAPVIKAPERDLSFAVATITLFGTAAVIVYPLIGHALGMSDDLFGHWVGAAVNDTSQVTATAFSYSVEAGETATIVKLTRNTLMVPVIFAVGMWFAARESRQAGADERRSWLGSARKAVPPFLIGFLALALVNSAGYIPEELATLLTRVSQVLIVMALVGVGLTTKVSALRQTGPAPFLMGLAVAVMLAIVSLVLFVAIGIG
jgi:uncharacterized integral membrane protein (TIGR00698 family)